jgi:hypothetical protein
MKAYGFIGFVGLIALAGLGQRHRGSEAGFVSRAAKEHHLTGDAKTAFAYCYADTRGSSIKGREGAIDVYLGVSEEVCACQAPHMVDILGRDRFGEHFWVVLNLGGGAPKKRRQDLPVMSQDRSPEGLRRVAQLSRTLQECARLYANEHNARADGRLSPGS